MIGEFVAAAAMELAQQAAKRRTLDQISEGRAEMTWRVEVVGQHDAGLSFVLVASARQRSARHKMDLRDVAYFRGDPATFARECVVNLIATLYERNTGGET